LIKIFCMDADNVCLPASLMASSTKKTNPPIRIIKANTINHQLSACFLGQVAQRFVPCLLNIGAHVWQRREWLRNPRLMLHVVLCCNEEVAASGWRATNIALTPPKHAGANEHSANTCCFLSGSRSFVGIFHHPNLGTRVVHVTGPVQSPPIGQG